MIKIESHHKWKGGRYKFRGYIYVLKKGHPLSNCGGYVLEHRLVASEKWGIEALAGKVVHHKNGERSDNRIENLEILLQSVHISNHMKGENSTNRIIGNPNPMIFCKCGCGNKRLKYDKSGRLRKYIYHHQGNPINMRSH